MWCPIPPRVRAGANAEGFGDTARTRREKTRDWRGWRGWKKESPLSAPRGGGGIMESEGLAKREGG